MPVDARQWRVAANVAGIRALKRLEDGLVVENEATNDRYRFDASSSAADDGDVTLKPDILHVSLPGRWIKSNPPAPAGSTPFEEIHWTDDFLQFLEDSVNGFAHGDVLWEDNETGGGIHSVSIGVANHPGVWRGRGTANGDVAALSRGFFKLGECSLMELEALIYFPDNVPDGTDDYIGWVGLTNTKTLNTFDNGMYGVGIYGRYSDDNTVRLIAYVNNGGASPTKEITDVAIVADTWYKVKIVYDGTDVKFYVNDVLKKTISAGIPEANSINPTLSIRKEVGTNNRLFGCDIIDFKIKPNR
jgi:hypothetical protein